MKKIISLALAAVMLLSFAACGGSTAKVKEPVDVLNAVWEEYADDQKFFAIGGDANNMVDNAPGKYDVAADPDATAAQLVCLEDSAKMVDSAAMLMHAMNSNNFTGAAYRIADGYKTEDFVNSMEKAISENQWICGFPERLLIVTVSDECVVIAFGAADIIETFRNNLTKVFPDASISTEKAL